MWRVVILAAALVVGCGSTVQQADRHTLPEPLVSTELPPEPAEVPEEHRWTRPVQQCVDTRDEETPAGILFSDEMAMRAARLRVAYDELRALYGIDQRTWERMRTVYETQLGLADDAIEEWQRRAERDWFERNAGLLGLLGGIVIGAAATIGIAFALDAALADGGMTSP